MTSLSESGRFVTNSCSATTLGQVRRAGGTGER
jgi:hypothetical protein